MFVVVNFLFCYLAWWQNRAFNNSRMSLNTCSSVFKLVAYWDWHDTAVVVPISPAASASHVWKSSIFICQSHWSFSIFRVTHGLSLKCYYQWNLGDIVFISKNIFIVWTYSRGDNTHSKHSYFDWLNGFVRSMLYGREVGIRWVRCLLLKGLNTHPYFLLNRSKGRKLFYC